MKRCVNCGEPIEDEDRFCSVCGAEQKANAHSYEDDDLQVAAKIVQEKATRKEAQRQRKEEKLQRAEYSTMPCEHGFDVDICMEAAQGGWAPAQRNLGMCYLTGRAVNTNAEDMIARYFDAVESDIVNETDTLDNDSLFDEQLMPGGMVKGGNKKTGIKWLRLAADSGDSNAQFYLGLCYVMGYGVEEDEEKAIKWLRRAAESGNVKMQLFFGKYLLDDHTKKATLWLTKAADAGDAMAQFLLAMCYMDGEGVEEDEDKGMVLLYKAAKCGSASATFMLKQMEEDDNDDDGDDDEEEDEEAEGEDDDDDKNEDEEKKDYGILTDIITGIASIILFG